MRIEHYRYTNPLDSTMTFVMMMITGSEEHEAHNDDADNYEIMGRT
jgi:hypothetical protein